ncbi:hypothetical protein Q7P37_010022 [Cladosporium fusiforme]
MAAPNGQFFIQDKLGSTAPHHESFQQLWETKWKQPCTMGVYPFMFGSVKDFEPIVERLIKEGQKPPYDWDNYAQAFFPKAEELVAAAAKAEEEGNKEKGVRAVLTRRYAWEEGKKAARKGLAMRERPTQEVTIQHKHGLPSEGKEIPFYYHLPPGTTKDKPVPLVIIFTGLDGYRTELAVWIEGWSQKGVGVVVLEIPGTGDSPADPTDPTSPDREWSSLLDWIDEQDEIDHKKVAVWAFSTGGYYAIRFAHTHANRLAGVVAHGGGCHYMFDERWLSSVNTLEYPFDLANTLAYKWGYGNDLEKFKKEASKFSLLEDGTLDKPNCARLLLVNGVGDEIFPIDDYELCLRHGAPKEARFIEDRKHMGEPESFFVIIQWIYNLFGIEGKPVDQMKTIPSRPRY